MDAAAMFGGSSNHYPKEKNTFSETLKDGERKIGIKLPVDIFMGLFMVIFLSI